MKILKYINKGVEKVEHLLIVVSLTLMVILTFLHVILRNLYTHAHFSWANIFLGQVDWTEPLVRLLVLWITFLGASLLTSENRHIKIDLMQSLISPPWVYIREAVLSFSCVLICALMLWASIDYIRIEMEFGSNLFLGVPAWICQLIIPAGFSVIIFRFFLRAIEQLLRIFRGDRS
ncbi:TRAP transporter small permease [Thermodesulfobacteriota bacterium]